ncbi:MAG: acetate--CoA ligase family protein [Planctomycetota bacterium]
MASPSFWFDRIDSILDRAYSQGRSFLYEFEVYEVLLCMGLNAPSNIYVPDLESFDPDALAYIRTPEVVVKVVSPHISHKSDVGGVVLCERTVEDVLRAYRKIRDGVTASAPDAEFCGVMVAEKIEFRQRFGHEVLASMRQDPFFGPVVCFGAGGLFTEFFAKEFFPGRGLSMRSTYGLDDDEISKMVRQPAICQPLSGRLRGVPRPLVEEEQLIRLLSALRDLADHYRPRNLESNFTIHELELNPVVVTEDKRLVAVDGLMTFDREKIESVPRPIEKIEKLLQPNSAFVVGASAKAMNPGRTILENLVLGEGVDKSKIWAIHPKEEMVGSVPAVKSLDDLPEPVDLAVVSVPASTALPLLQETVEKRAAHSVILISGGFAETEDGREREERLRMTLAESHREKDGGVIINGGNCLGIYSKPGGYNTFFLPPYKVAFREARGENIAMISQSGAYLVSQTSNFEKTIRPRYAISFGNQIDLTVTDYLEYMKDDPEIDVFAIYLEGFRPYAGRGFLEVADQIVTSGRNIIMFKSGRTEEGTKAAASHTAAMTGDYKLAAEVLAQVGVIGTDTLNMFEDYLKTFAFLKGKPSVGNRVGILSNAGFECTVAADRLHGLSLAEFSPETRERIGGNLPKGGIVAVHNPIDTTPTTPTEQFLDITEAMLEDDGVDCVVTSPLPLTPALNTLPKGEGHPDDIEREDSVPKGLIRLARKTKKPMVVCLDSGRLYDPMVEMLELEGIPVFRRIDRATRALSAYVTRRNV